VSYSFDPSGGEPTGTDDRSSRRVLVLFAVSLIVVGLGGLAAVLALGRHRDTPTVSGGGSAGTLEVGGLGPAPGQDLPAYMAERAKALAAATGERAAVVSLASYKSEAQARAAAGKLAVTSLLAAVPGGSPSVVNGPMSQWVNAQVAEQRSERDEMQKLIPTVDDPQFKDFYRQEVERITKLIDTLRPDGTFVYGMVVRGPVPALQALAARPGVRLVDLAPGAEVRPDVPIRGVRPEEKQRANDPPKRPV
jgi:hypothetical protein